MQPEVAKKQENSAELVKEIKSSLEANYTNAKLGQGGDVAISVRPDIMSMAECTNRNDGTVSQELKMVIKAGSEFFSVIDVFAADKSGHIKTTVLSRHIEGARAEFVGQIDGSDNPLTVGRSTENGYADDVSRKHFAIGCNPKNGGLDIMDLKSTNGVEMFVAIADSDGSADGPNPVDNIEFWSVKSSELKSEVLGNS